MSEEEPKGLVSGIISLARNSKHPAVELFVIALFSLGALAVMMSLPAILAGVVKTSTSVMSGEVPVQAIWRNCFDLKEVGGRTYKIDQCSGKIQPLKKDDDED